MNWNPEALLKSGGYRSRPSAELLARIPLGLASTIYDLGCGMGNSTAVLKDRFPKAHIVAIDADGEAIAQARRSGPKSVEWREGKIEAFAPGAPADLIYSNAAFQWVENHAEEVPRIFSLLAPGGALAFQMPANVDEPTHRLIAKTLGDLGLEGPARAAAEASRVLPARHYYAALSGAARSIDIWDTEYYQPLEGKDPVLAWMSAGALVPVLAALAEGDRPAFLARYGAALRTAYPPEADGRTILPFRRRFVVAVRA